MILIIETNFVLEAVFQQEEFAACEKLLGLCGGDRPHHLVLPAFSLAEARMTMERRHGERQQFVQEDVTRHGREVGVRNRFNALPP